MLIEVINDDTNKQVQGEKGAKDDEDYKVDVHVDVVLILGLLFLLNVGMGRERDIAKTSIEYWYKELLSQFKCLC